MRGAWPVGLLLLVSVAAALWAARPLQGFDGLAPEGAGTAAGVGATAAIVAVLAITLAGALIVWLARREARTAVQWFLLAANGFGLLLLLVPLVLRLGGSPAAWLLAVAVAVSFAFALRAPGWPAWTGSALAAGGFAGLLAAVAGLPVLALLVAAVCVYDAWAVRRRRMARVADAAAALGAPLQVGLASDRDGGLSLGLGDLLLPAALVAAAPLDGPRLGLALLGLVAGFAALSAGVRRWGDLPGTPFLCGGALSGIAAGLLAR